MPAPLGPRDRNYDIMLTEIQTRHRLEGFNWVHVSSNPDVSDRAVLNVSNPYRPAKPDGLRPPTARTLYFERRKHGRRTREWTHYSTGVHYRVSGVSSTPMNVAHGNLMGGSWKALEAQLRNEALIDCLQKVKDGKWNAGVMLAESQGVARMAVDLANTIAKTRYSLRHGDFKGAYQRWRKSDAGKKAPTYPRWRRQYLNAHNQRRYENAAERSAAQALARRVRKARRIPSGWTYYHFGIKPTVNDISDAIESVSSISDDRPYEFGGTATGYAKHTTKWTVDNDIHGYEPRDNGLTHYSVLYSVRVNVGVQPKPGFLGRLSTLGVTNVPDALWNGTPFSWVVDYLSSVGDWLNVLDVGIGWRFDTVWTESWREAILVKFTPVSGRGIYYPTPPQPDTLRRKSLTRRVRSDLYGPLGQVIPKLKIKGPSVHQFSMLMSVLATSFRSGPRF